MMLIDAPEGILRVTLEHNTLCQVTAVAIPRKEGMLA